jgi:hypothetical protein
MKIQLLKGIALGLFVSTMASPLYAQTAEPAKPAAAPAAEPAKPAAAPVAEPATPAAEPAIGELGFGVGSMFASMFYMPAKVTYAGLGLLAGGLGYVLSGGRADVANNIIAPAIGGHYVVTPNQLKGADPLYFVGAPAEPPAVQTYAAGTLPKP